MLWIVPERALQLRGVVAHVHVDRLVRDRHERAVDLLDQPPLQVHEVHRLQSAVQLLDLARELGSAVLDDQIHELRVPLICPWEVRPREERVRLEPGDAVEAVRIRVRLAERLLREVDVAVDPHETLEGGEDLDARENGPLAGVERVPLAVPARTRVVDVTFHAIGRVELDADAARGGAVLDHHVVAELGDSRVRIRLHGPLHAVRGHEEDAERPGTGQLDRVRAALAGHAARERIPVVVVSGVRRPPGIDLLHDVDAHIRYALLGDRVEDQPLDARAQVASLS
jgi:hypothetical protein